MILRLLVSANGSPIQRLGGGRRVRELFGGLVVVPFGFRPALMHELDASQSDMELGHEFVAREIALQAMLLVAFRVEDENGRCPERLEAVENGSALLDVARDRDEVLVDEPGYAFVAV